MTHPANWGEFKRDLLRQALRHGRPARRRLLTEPEAAAIHYARPSGWRPAPTVAVYDLGGGTFDAAVLRRTARRAVRDRWAEPEGIERLGGIDFDEAVFDHVLPARVADARRPRSTPDDDPALSAAAARLRRDCVEAKEALSAETPTSPSRCCCPTSTPRCA